VARILGNPAAGLAAGDSPALAPPPAALRATRPGWRDPRLWIGVAIVAGCVVGGARILGAADDTVGVWAVRADEGAGAVLGRSDLEVRQVHFARSSDLAGYVRADGALPDQLPLTRAVGRGELLPRSAIASGGATGTVQVPLAVDPVQVPPAVTSGSIVDVYVVGAGDDAGDGAGDGARAGAGAGGGAAQEPALSAATVVAAPRPDDVFGSGQTTRQLTLAVPERRAQAFFGLLSGLDDPTITVVLRPAG
jgi:hypothetical protein